MKRKQGPVVIRVDKLSKRYKLGQVHGNLLSERIGLGLKSLSRRFWGCSSNFSTVQRFNDSTFWALRDVSFEIKQGEVVGIVGRNGTGKSTLLKILSRVTGPTEGEVELLGRVGSLLEVGTGFHPELTGRENIFMNGAILGMKRAEIKNRFDEIVGFAEVEKFVDTPVKHYSSGMYVRLAFAVAAHLEPEVLLVDEVLAVGDTAFQKKCLGKIGEVARGGRTVLFVSHNMASVKALCGRAILLEGGRVVMEGDAVSVVDRYLQDAGTKVTSYSMAAGKKPPCFRSVELIQEERNNGIFAADRPVRISFSIDSGGKKGLGVNLYIRNEQGVCIHHSSDSFGDSSGEARTCEIPAHGLAAGRYHVDVSLCRGEFEVFDYLQDALIFQTGLTAATDERARAARWRGLCGPGLITWK
ncbi:MAG: polysaccharide ABC transporter ATP-binding protein [Nitrospiraceae bacterium]|nr:polysaccharide ABC transporter ATP-binding protein [Nitrospiraceae bacterium]